MLEEDSYRNTYWNYLLINSIYVARWLENQNTTVKPKPAMVSNNKLIVVFLSTLIALLHATRTPRNTLRREVKKRTSTRKEEDELDNDDDRCEECVEKRKECPKGCSTPLNWPCIGDSKCCGGARCWRGKCRTFKRRLQIPQNCVTCLRDATRCAWGCCSATEAKQCGHGSPKSCSWLQCRWGEGGMKCRQLCVEEWHFRDGEKTCCGGLTCKW